MANINVGNRKAQQTIKQIQAKGFEKIGDQYAGTYTGTKHAMLTDEDGKQREATLIMLQPDDGDKFGVWANKVLEDMIQDVPVGTFVVIKFVGEGKKKGKKAGAKLFEITPYA